MIYCEFAMLRRGVDLVADTGTSALSQTIHGDVVTLGNQVDQLHVRAEKLQSSADR